MNLSNQAWEAQAADLINEAVDEIDLGAEPIEGKEFFSSMRRNTINKHSLNIYPRLQSH